MKKEIIIKFDIYQDKLDNQKPKPILYIETLPEKEDSMTIDEINKTTCYGIKLDITKQKEMSEHLGRTYYCRVKGKLLEDVLEKLNK